jgi:hypothetical protein
VWGTPLMMGWLQAVLPCCSRKGQRFVRAPSISRVRGERSETPISGLPEIGS